MITSRVKGNYCPPPKWLADVTIKTSVGPVHCLNRSLFIFASVLTSSAGHQKMWFRNNCFICSDLLLGVRFSRMSKGIQKSYKQHQLRVWLEKRTKLLRSKGKIIFHNISIMKEAVEMSHNNHYCLHFIFTLPPRLVTDKNTHPVIAGNSSPLCNAQSTDKKREVWGTFKTTGGWLLTYRNMESPVVSHRCNNSLHQCASCFHLFTFVYLHSRQKYIQLDWFNLACF